MPRAQAEVAEDVVERSLELIERDIERATESVALWSGSLEATLADLAEVEAQEGELDPEDPRLGPIKICVMRLEELRTLLMDLREEREELVNSAGLN